MTTIDTTVDIGSDRRLAIQLPDQVTPGRHRVILHVHDGQGTSQPTDIVASLPRLDLGAWPAGLSLRREDVYGDDGR
jgi:hypothetical protein